MIFSFSFLEFTQSWCRRSAQLHQGYLLVISYFQIPSILNYKMSFIFTVYVLTVLLLPTHQTAIASNTTKSPSIVCTDPFSSIPNGFSIEFITGDFTVSLLTNEQFTLAAINLDSLNEVLNVTSSKLGNVNNK